MQKIPLLLRVVFLHFMVVIGALGLNRYLISSVPQPTSSFKNSPSVPKQKAVKIVQDKPYSLSIPALEINLPVLNGNYNALTKTWDLSDSSVYYATSTQLPGNQPGLTMIYGHNIPTVLERTSNLKPGDLLLLKSFNGHTFAYIYRTDYLTAPNDSSMLGATYSKPTLALLTCNGLWSDKRRFMFFELQEIK